MPFLSQGSYGCIFYPHLKCSNNIKIDNAVGKIFKFDNNATEEKKLIQYINNIDPHSNWTIPYHGSCYTNINNANSSDNISQCKHNIKSNKEQLLFEHSGIDLTNIDFNNTWLYYNNELINVPFWLITLWFITIVFIFQLYNFLL